MSPIKHNPLFDIHKVCELYSKKDGVTISYVCTSALGDENFARDIFYRETPHPQFGNRYFALFYNIEGDVMITNADDIENKTFGFVNDDDGNFQYSEHRHAFKSFKNGNMIDGGRAYIKHSGDVVYGQIRNGMFNLQSNCD